jgi:hypothetical protein
LRRNLIIAGIVLVISVPIIVYLLTVEPVIEVQPVKNLAAGLTKSVSVRIISHGLAIGPPMVSPPPQVTYKFNDTSTPTTEDANKVASDLWDHELAQSEKLTEGQRVTVTWKVPLQRSFPVPFRDGLVTADNSFNVGQQAQIKLPTGGICVRQNETKEVHVQLEPSGSTANLSFTVDPANLAQLNPDHAEVGPGANSIDVKGLHVNEGSLIAQSATLSASTNLRVIVPLATSQLVSPDHGATQVFFPPNPEPTHGTAIVQVRFVWSSVPNARDYSICAAQNNGNCTFNSTGADTSRTDGIQETFLSFPPRTIVRWKIKAMFDTCPADGDGFGPESQERTFTVWASAP